MIVPYGAGGGTDITLRAVQKKAEAVLGQSFVIEYRAGGGTLIGPKWSRAPRRWLYAWRVRSRFLVNPTIQAVQNMTR